jgi:plastocyanin
MGGLLVWSAIMLTLAPPAIARTFTIEWSAAPELLLNASISIHVGDTVIWNWAMNGLDCNLLFGNGTWDGENGEIVRYSSNHTYERQFNISGSFPYFCSATKGISAMITVLEGIYLFLCNAFSQYTQMSLVRAH